jgi:hypothetical protein
MIATLVERAPSATPGVRDEAMHFCSAREKSRGRERIVGGRDRN